MTTKKDTPTVTEEKDIQVEGEPQRIKCGLIMPISKSQGLGPEHWLDVKGIINEALIDTGFDVRLVSDSDEVGVIHKSIVQNIFKDDIVICDVSTHNPNVMFELGLRLAFDKPTVIIKDDETPFSFDTQVIQHIVYKRSLHYPDIVSFKNYLKMKVLATLEQSRNEGYSTFLKHFTIDHVAKISEREVGKDELILEQLSIINRKLNSQVSGVKQKDSYGTSIGGGVRKLDGETNVNVVLSAAKNIVHSVIDDFMSQHDMTKDEMHSLLFSQTEPSALELENFVIQCRSELRKEMSINISSGIIETYIKNYLND